MLRVASLVLLGMLLLPATGGAAPLNGVLTWTVGDGATVAPEGQWNTLHPFAPRRASGPSIPQAVYILQREGDPLPVSSGSVELVIEDLAFSRRMIAVRSNTILNLSNRSLYTLTVRLLDESRQPEDSVMLSPGGTGRVAVPEKGVFYLQALEFSHLSAVVVVTPHGQEIVPGPDGRFTLPDLPAGRYRLLVWAGHWVEGKPFEVASDTTQVTVLADARRGMLVGVTVRVTTAPAAAPPAPPVPEIPPVPPAPSAPPRVSTPATPPTPPAPPAPGPQTAPASGNKGKEKPKPPKPATPKSDDAGDDGGFFKIKELD